MTGYWRSKLNANTEVDCDHLKYKSVVDGQIYCCGHKCPNENQKFKSRLTNRGKVKNVQIQRKDNNTL